MLREAELHNFRDQLEWGEEGEQSVASYLIGNGVSVSPLYQFNADCAPYMLTMDERIILPDLTCWSRGNNYFVECKRKRQWVNYQGALETGLNKKHYNHYWRVKAKTEQDVYLFFLHEDKGPNGLYFGELADLEPHKRVWDGLNPNGEWRSPEMVFFPITSLKKANSKEVSHQMV